MSLNVNNVEIENVIVKNKTTGEQTELEEMYADGTLVWEKKKSYEYILTMRPSSESRFGYLIAFSVHNTTGIECVVSCETKDDVIVPGVTEENGFYVEFSFSKDEDLNRFYKVSFIGGFDTITLRSEGDSNSGPGLYQVVGEILKWQTNMKDKLWQEQFQGAYIVKDLTIPNKVKDLSNGCFDGVRFFDYGANTNYKQVYTNLYLPNELTAIDSITKTANEKLIDNYFYVIGDICVRSEVKGVENIVLPSQPRVLADCICCYESSTSGAYCFDAKQIIFPDTANWSRIPDGFASPYSKTGFGTGSIERIEFPSYIKEIGNNAFQNSNVKYVVFPSSVEKIGRLSFPEDALTELRFNQPSGMVISLPQAGSTDGAFYNKTARTVNIYTENEYVKAYDWGLDNITPTFYHLDGTAWEV